MNNNKMQLENNTDKTTFSLLPMAIIGLLFFIFGFVTWLNGSLIPFLEMVCELTAFQALLVTFFFYIAYTLMALPASKILEKTGYKNGMALGLGIMALGSLVFVPAALLAAFPVFLLGLFALGGGLTLLQTASNPYIVLMGPEESAATRISIMGIINKSAGVLAPLVFAAWVLSGIDLHSEASLAVLSQSERIATLEQLSHQLIAPYIGLAVVLLLLMVFIFKSPLPDLRFEPVAPGEKSGLRAVMQYPHTLLGVVALFMGVGVEVIAGDTIGLYGRQLGLDHFVMLTSYTMVCMVLGYLLGIFAIPRWISQQHALAISALSGLVISLGVVMSDEGSYRLSSLILAPLGVTAVPDPILYLALLGLANALVWPTVWPLALCGLGKHTGTASALLVMAIAGGAVLPLIYGHFSHQSNAQQAYLILLPCYLFILFYATKGHRLKRWS